MNFPMPLGFLSRGAAAFDPDIFVAFNDRVGALATWSPTDKNANLTLSGGNLTVSTPALVNHRMVRATHSISPTAGKAYWEFDPNGSMGAAASNYVTIIGQMIGGTSVADGQYVSFSGQGCAQGYASDAAASYNNGWTGSVPSGISNTVHSLAYDPVAGKFYIGTGSAWFGGSDPWTNLGMFVRSAAAAPMFPALSMYQVCTWTANFGATPFKCPLSSIVGARQGGPNCVLLLHCEGVGNSAVQDRGTPPHYVAQSGGSATQFDTSVFKFGTSSLKFAGGLIYPNSGSELVFGTSDFTVDLWFWPNAIGSVMTLFDWQPGVPGIYPTAYIASDGKMYYFVNSTNIITGTTAATAAAWNHYALTRQGTNTRQFLNGVQQGPTWTGDTNNYGGHSQRPLFGVWGTDGTSYQFQGRMDEIRILKGQAAWTSDFTPPTAPYS